MKRIFSGMSALGFLVACGSSSVPVSTKDIVNNVPTDVVTIANIATFSEFADASEDALQDARAIASLSPTSESNVPNSGTARFDGAASIFIDRVISRDDDDILILADSTLTADFGTGRIRGKIDNLTAATDLGVTSGRIVNSSGQVLLGSRTTEIGSNRPGDFELDYLGTVRVGSTNYDLDGDAQGRFQGNRADKTQFPTKGLVGSGEGAAKFNGNNKFSSIEFFGTTKP